MATSNSIDFTQNRDQIVTNALRLLGELGKDQTMDGNDIDIGANFLNMLIKHWGTMGIHIWKRTEAVVVLEKNTNTYTLSSSGAHAADLDDFVWTTLGAAAASGASSITVTSATGLAISDNIGIELDTGSLQWTTISNIVGTTITLGTTLTSAAALDNVIYGYTTKLQRPLEILDPARKRNKQSKDIPVTKISHEEYFLLNDKTSQGTVNSFYYDRRLDTGKLYVWQTPSTSTETLQITYLKTIEDFDTSINTPDFPQEWFLTLTYNLAAYIAPIYGKDTKVMASIMPMASSLLDSMYGWDEDHEPIQFIVPRRNY